MDMGNGNAGMMQLQPYKGFTITMIEYCLWCMCCFPSTVFCILYSIVCSITSQ